MSHWRDLDQFPRCPVTGKISFPNERIAKRELLIAKANHREEKRYYQCGFCPGFHLTQKPDMRG